MKYEESTNQNQIIQNIRKFKKQVEEMLQDIETLRKSKTDEKYRLRKKSNINLDTDNSLSVFFYNIYLQI